MWGGYDKRISNLEEEWISFEFRHDNIQVIRKGMLERGWEENKDKESIMEIFIRNC